MPSHQFYLAPDLANPLAAIDIGSNSMRLIIAEGLRDGKYRILDDEKESTRLGANLASTGRLAPEAVERSLQALKRFKQILDGYQVGRIRAIATCAVREALDGEAFCQRVRDEIGLEIEVITSKQEARLSYLSVQRNFDLSALDVVTADIGGGSTELVLASGGVVEAIYPTPLGAVRLTEQFKAEQRLPRTTYERMLEHIDGLLRDKVGKPPFQPQLLIGTGGTFTAIAGMVMANKRQEDMPIRGYVVRRAEVRHLLDQLSKLSLSRRRSLPGLSIDRADIIVAGVAIVDRLMAYFECNRLQIHTGGVRDGLLLTMVDNVMGQVPSDTQSLDRAQAVARFAKACGVDMLHGERVARLAVQIYNQLQAAGLVKGDCQAILEAASMLQDVGYLINYEDHHKHSFHLIMNSDLSGFPPHELQLIANVCRYHRGAEPKRKHAAFSQLMPEQQLKVRQLAAILRMAGGCDRSHTQQVTGVDLKFKNKECDFTLLAASEPEVDLWGVRRRAGMFEKVFNTTVKTDWRLPPAEAAAS